MPNLLLRVRNLRTNFYTYAGVVKALDGVSFDMWEGDTLGLVGETGCGKSVTALSILRLIAQPPGKIEEGEALFDVPADVVRRIEDAEVAARDALARAFGDAPETHPDDLGVNRLNQLWREAEARGGMDPADREVLKRSLLTLAALKRPYDLLAKSDAEMRAIRGSKIAMIFQEPMQALNPVFPIGDQVAENILLHQRDSVVRALVDKMDLEQERDAIGSELRTADPEGKTSLRPLPPSERLPGSFTFVLLAWIAASAIGLALFAAIAAIPTLAGGGMPGPVLAFASAVVIANLLAGIGAMGLAPWSRLLGIVFAALQGLLGLFLILLPFAAWFKFFLLAGALIDLLIIQQMVRPEAKEALVGRRRGWLAALAQAEGDPGELSEFRDWIAASRLEDRTRERLTRRLDAFIARANAILEPDEPVTGHFHPLFPRRIQVSFYRGLRDRPTASLAGVVRRFPFLKRLVDRPIYEEAVRRAIGILHKVKISDPARIAGQYPYELSGGMQQRSLIAIALSCNPRLLIADEPTTALDVTIQAQILELIREMKKEFGSSVLLITHDLGIIADMCSRVCVMYAGHIVEDASVRAVFKAPLHPYTQGLMRAVPSHTVRKEALEIIRGSVPNLIHPPPGCRFHPRCPKVMPTCGWSPAEVGEHLRDKLRAMPVAARPFDIEGIAWEEAEPTELRITFPAGTDLAAGVEAVRRAVEAGRERPALGAVVSVEAVPGEAVRKGETRRQVRVRILPPRKPPDFAPEPGHAVACLLYEAPAPVPLAGGGQGA